MLNVGPPAGNGHLDTILQSGHGETGDHVDRQPAFGEAMKDSNDVESPEVNKAQVYDGQWKNL